MLTKDEAIGAIMVFVVVGWLGATVAIAAFFGLGWAGVFVAATMAALVVRVVRRLRKQSKKVWR